MENTRIIELTYELISIIKESNSYKLYKEYEEKIFLNPNTKQLLREFQNKKERFEEAFQYGEYYPDYEKIKKDFQQSKINLMNNELFQNYKKNERIIERELMETENRIKDLLNIKEKHGKKSIIL